MLVLVLQQFDGFCNLIHCTEWITILCLEDNKEYTCSVRNLEREDGFGISDKDLTPGNQLIWHYRGTPYEAEVIKVQGRIMYSSYIVYVLNCYL